MGERQYSSFQNAIFEFAERGKGNAVVEAVAGSGKTTTIVEAANRLSPSLSSLFLAFNKSIAEELAKRLPSHVVAKTLNGLGHGAWMKHIGRKRVMLDTSKTRSIMDDRLTEGERRAFGSAVIKLVSLAKATGIVPMNVHDMHGLLADEMTVWQDMIDWHDIDLTEEDRSQRFRKQPQQQIHLPRSQGDVEEVVDLVRDVLSSSIERAFDGYIDFDDQIYMTVIAKAKIKHYDFIFVDEAQDLNVTQRAMLRLALKKKGRIVAVGDPHQAIYGFRGADSESMANLKEEFDAITLPLSISYRCPVVVVQEAQRFVNHIQSHPEAPQGTVGRLETFSAATFHDNDAILCRMTGYLVEMAFNLIREKKRCKVLGRDIGKGLIAIIKKMNAQDINDLWDRLDSYEQRERDRFLSKGMEEKAASVSDKVGTIRVCLEQLPENDRTIERLNREIEDLFSDPRKDCVMLATVHKAKGMEWPRVFILNEFLMPCKWATQDWQKAQEINIQYVAVTRAKNELYYIDTVGFKKAIEVHPELAEVVDGKS